jgi:hypothetical protein
MPTHRRTPVPPAALPAHTPCCAAPNLLRNAPAQHALPTPRARYAAAKLGPSFTEPAPWTLEEVFGDTSARAPILFILSTGGPRGGGGAPAACRSALLFGVSQGVNHQMQP